MTKKYWLMKTEPDVFSIDDLKRDKTTLWEGVRNYQARNYMTNEMKVGDLALIYHSSTVPPGVAGIMEISKAAAPDATQFDKKSEYYDEKSTRENPRWHCVQGKFSKKFSHFVTLDQLKSHPALKNMLALRKGNRLSITPVTESEFNTIVASGESAR
ncbi:MAG TPA: EVE domain-containing protein [Bdellovibrionota bacterium]|nr:EVE domain-containing protein [Bdellovibrionota bacterium]